MEVISQDEVEEIREIDQLTQEIAIICMLEGMDL